MKPSPLLFTSPSRQAWWWLGATALALAGAGVALWPKAQPPAGDPPPAAQVWGSGASPFASSAPGAWAPSAAVPRPADAAASAGKSPAAATALRPPLPMTLPPVERPAESLRKVQMALGGGSPQEAFDAGVTLEFCKHAAPLADSMHRGREELSPLVPPDIRKALDKMAPPPATKEQLDRADQEQRRCQAFDAATLARSGELLRRAYEGGAQGAANMYLVWLQNDGKDQATPALIATLQAQVRASAEAGDFMSLASAAHGSASTLAATPVQVQAYREAWLRIGEESSPGSTAQTKNFFAALDELGHVQPLTPAQQREADALAQQIVEAWRKRQHKGG